MSASDDFKIWLNEKLQALKLDESVFGTYIIGILEGDETDEEKSDALEGILSEIIDIDLEALKGEVLQKWQECTGSNGTAKAQRDLASIDVDEKLARLLEVHKIQSQQKEREYTDEERRIKEQILAQYSQTEVTDDEDDVVGDHADKPSSAASHNSAGGGSAGPSTLNGLERNTNKEDVAALAKARREQARLDSAAKKQKDKEDREKQKKEREEKKEKRKTVKGERRR